MAAGEDPQAPGTAAPPASTLWVGNLPASATDAGVMATFSGRGALDCVTMRGGARSSYAFVMFRSVDDARGAMEALQGGTYAGADDASAGPKLRIEFSRPARAAKHIWIGGVSKSITKEELEEEFAKYGKIEYFAFFRDRNSALIDYCNLEDAISSVKNLNGKTVGGEQLTVDFQRLQPPRMELFDHDNKSISRGMSGPVGRGAVSAGVASDTSHYAARKPLGRKHVPSNILWIGYPATVQVDSEMLHNAMILFGELEGIRCYPERHFAFVEFRNVDEARRAKEGLEGRLFNDPRIIIEFSTNAHDNDNSTQYPGRGSSGLSVFTNENRLGSQYRGNASGIAGLFSTTKSISSSLRKRSPTNPGILPLPDIYASLDTRDAKRLRASTYLSGASGRFSDARLSSYLDRGASIERQISPSVQSHSLTPDTEYCWRGTLAKGGSYVCRARCVPYGKGIDAPFPEIVNCSARTGLDMLTKHFADAVGFGVVFFLPDSEEDFASYTEFLLYLSQKNRAGVAKLDDGTTIFLVPPSDFLTNVLNVDGPERLYGVFLDLPQQQPGPVVHQPLFSGSSIQSNHPTREDVASMHNSQGVILKHGNQALSATYDGNHTESLHISAGANPLNTFDGMRSTQTANFSTMDKQEVAPQVKVSLTPELIASLASLVPRNVPAPPSATVQNPAAAIGMTVTSGVHDAVLPVQNFRQEFQLHSTSTGPEQRVDFLHHPGQPLVTQAPLVTQLPSYTSFSNGQDHSSLLRSSGPESQNMPLNMLPSLPTKLPPPPPLPPVAATALALSSYGEHYMVPQSDQNYYNNTSFASQSGHVVLPTPTLTNNYDPKTQTQQVQSFPASTQDSSLQGGDSGARNPEVFRQTLELAAKMLRQMNQDQYGGGVGQQQSNGFSNLQR